MEMRIGDFVINISDTETGQLMRRPAILLWELPDGFAWVEPGYLEPLGAPSPQFHRLYGAMRKYLGAIQLTNDEISALATSAGEASGLEESFEWYKAELARLGRDRSEEAERLQKRLASDLA